MARLRHGCVLALLNALLATVVEAQAAAPASEALFRAGREAMQQGDPATACAEFGESYRLEHALGTLLNIGVCEEALGELGNAWQHYQEVTHALPDDDARVAIAREHLQTLEPRLPRLTVRRASGAPEDMRASIGGIELEAASFEIPLPMDPGHYELQAIAPGREPRAFSLDLREGDRRTLEIEPGQALPAIDPDAASAAPAESTQPSARSGAPRSAVASDAQAARAGVRNLVAYTLLGAGSASLLVAGISGAFMFDRAAVVDDHCAGGRCDVQGLTAARSGQTLYIVSLTTLGVGLMSVGSALYLLLSQKPSARSVSVDALLSPGVQGLSIRGRL